MKLKSKPQRNSCFYFRMFYLPLLILNKFASHVSEIRALESSQSSSRKNLDDLFQSMLHRAFQGEL